MSLFNTEKTIKTTVLQSHTDNKFELMASATSDRQGWISLRQHNFHMASPMLVLSVQRKGSSDAPWQFNLTPEEAIALGNDLIIGATTYLTELKQKRK